MLPTPAVIDAVRLAPQHIRNGRLRYRQAKNEHRNPIDIDIVRMQQRVGLAPVPAAATVGKMDIHSRRRGVQ